MEAIYGYAPFSARTYDARKEHLHTIPIWHASQHIGVAHLSGLISGERKDNLRGFIRYAAFRRGRFG